MFDAFIMNFMSIREVDLAESVLCIGTAYLFMLSTAAWSGSIFSPPRHFVTERLRTCWVFGGWIALK